MADVAVGEQRTANGETREWTGSEWKPVNVVAPISANETDDPRTAAIQALKDYASELLSGKGTARSAVADYGGKELSGAASTLNPINQIRGLVNTVQHPLDTASGLVDTGKKALSGDPESVGSVLGMALLPKVNAGLLKGTNSAATAVAEKPMVRSGIGYVGGALAGKAMGVSPFVGGALGRMVSPLLERPAAEVASATGWLREKLGLAADAPDKSMADVTGTSSGATPYEMKGAPSDVPAGSFTQVMPMTDAEYEARAGRPRGAVPDVKPTAKPSLSANDVVRIKLLIKNGLSEPEAVARVVGK